MGTVSRVHTFASGAILTAAQLNNEFDNLLTSSAINGGLDATNLGVTAGQATASKALVVDASRNLADATGSNRINNLALSGTFESTGAVTASAGITSGGNIVSDTDSTDDLGTTGVRWANLFVDDVTVTNNVTIGGTLTLTGGITLNGNTTIGDSSADTLTVNSTITSNLIFTDATYDIGASGATRPRDLFLSRNAVMGGTLGVTGLITATGGVSGALTGNVTGNVTGDVTGDLTGNVTGNVTGNLTGDVTGNISGNVTGGTISGTTGTFSGQVTGSNGAHFTREGLNLRVENTNTSFTGNAWQMLVTDSATVNQSNANYALALFQTSRPTSSTGQILRVINDGASNVAMTLFDNGDFAVDTDTLFVDASADRVGINTVSADAPLHIIGSNGDPSAAHSGGAQLILENNGTTFLELATGTTHYSAITFSDDVASRGAVIYDHGTSLGGGADSLHFQTAGSQKAVINASGNFGLGTVSPVALSNQTSLTINGTSVGRVDVKAGGGGGGVMFGTSSALTVQANSGVAVNLDSASGQPITFQVGSSEKARITSAGVMQVGGQTGTLKLGNDGTYYGAFEWEYANNELAHTINNVGTHTFNTNSKEVARFTQSNGSGGLTLKSNAGNTLIAMGPEGSGGNEEKVYIAGYANGTQKFSIGASTGPTWFNTGQNFGIGTSSPTRVLDIVQSGAASMRLASGATSNVSYVYYENSTGGIFEIGKYGTARTDVKYGQTLGGWSLVSDNDSASNGLAIGTASASAPIVFGTNNTERARITSDGDLLIGETTNQIARVYATTSITGDYAYIGQTTTAGRGPASFVNTNSSFNDIMLVLQATRAATTGYDFARFNSSAGADIEFLFEGDGTAYADGSWQGSGADYQEYFESQSGSAAEVGRAIVLDGDRVRYYNADTDSTDAIMGVTRPEADNKNSAVVGNVAWNHWTDKYLTDDWGVYLREDVTVWTYTDDEGNEFAVYERDELAKDPNWTPPEGATSSTQSVRKLNPDYDESLDNTYQSREARDEWWLVGLLGQIQVKAGEPVNPRWIKMKNISDAVELYYVR